MLLSKCFCVSRCFWSIALSPFTPTIPLFHFLARLPFGGALNKRASGPAWARGSRLTKVDGFFRAKDPRNFKEHLPSSNGKSNRDASLMSSCPSK